MSQPCLAPMTPVAAGAATTDGPSPQVHAPLDPVWKSWADRLESLAAAACRRTRESELRASRVTVQLRLASGRTLQRTLTLPRPTDRPDGLRAEALGLLRILLAEAPEGISAVGLRLGGLVEGANQPIQFERYLSRKRAQSRVGALARVAGLLAALGCLGGLVGTR